MAHTFHAAAILDSRSIVDLTPGGTQSARQFEYCLQGVLFKSLKYIRRIG